MRREQIEGTVLSLVALLMAGIAPNIFPAAQAGYAKMSYLGAHLLLPSLVVLAATLAASVLRVHRRLTRRLVAGAGAGLVGTVGLEAVRMTSFHLGGMPGDLPRLMGVLLTDRFMLGPSPLSDVLGWLYHFWNGACFGIIFSVVLGRRAVWWAVVYGELIGLGFLVSPAVKSLGIGFMGMDRPAMPLTVAVAHLAYGAILGMLTHRWLGREPWRGAGWPHEPLLREPRLRNAVEGEHRG